MVETRHTATDPIEVSPNSLPTTIMTVLRYILTAFGALLVSKHILPIDTNIEQIVGALLIVANAGYGGFKSFQHNEEKKTMEPYAPNTIAKLKT